MLELIKKRWIDLSTISKAVFVFLIVVLVSAFLYFATWIFEDNYQVLFSDLNAQDASNMIAELERNKTPYKLAENGTSILVETDSVYKTRLKLVGKGLNLNGSVGFELFNNAEFGMTEFAQKVNYLRALQGELERTIMGFDEIKSARVHLVLPESGLFKRKAAVPKASVTISVRDNAELALDKVVGIQRLVSASVPEVTAAEVTVVDQRGLALTKNYVASDNQAFVSQRLEVKKELESYMTQKLINVLDRVVGPGKAIITVDISVNYDQVKVTKEEVMPLPNANGQAVGAVARKRTTHQVDQNQVSSFDDDLTSTRQSQPSKASTSEIDYVNNRRVEQVLSSPGAINRLSVGILVPNVKDPVKLSKIKEVVEMTAGISPERGDGVVVHDIDIPTINAVAAMPHKVVPAKAILQPQATKIMKKKVNIDEVSIEEQLLSIWQYLLVGGILLLALLYLMFRKKQNDTVAMSAESRDKLLDEINVWASSQRAVN